jgi:tight adherence protein B
VRSFAETFRTARRSGGDLVSITRTSAQRIGEKIEVQREIRTLISGKQMEGKIMNIVPLAMIAYFWVCSPGFLDCFYQGFSGRFIMTCLLGVYLAAYLLSRKICDIKV